MSAGQGVPVSQKPTSADTSARYYNFKFVISIACYIIKKFDLLDTFLSLYLEI